MAERIVNPVPGLPPAPPFLSSAVRSNGFVFASGQVGTKDGVMVTGPIERRVDQILDNLDAVFRAHGTSLQNVVKTNIFITDYANFDAINKAYSRRIPNPPPARSCIGAGSLPFGTDVEIEMVAAIPGSGRQAKL